MDTNKITRFKWPKTLGAPHNIGQYFPDEIHALFPDHRMKRLLVRMAQKPAFRETIYDLAAEEPE